MEVSQIQSRIYEKRDQKVMLDFDLAALYGVETKVLNQAVKRNSDRFPPDFMFRLTKAEWVLLRSQFVTLETGRGKYPKFLPAAFTEHGVTMAASIVHSAKAIQMNIAIVRAFVALKELAIQQPDFNKRLETIKAQLSDRIDEHDTQLKAIYDAIENLLDDKAEQRDWQERERIGYR